jgi:lipid-A-disaccharide synthase
MKYYLIVGEASGDLHASHLMRALKDIDAEAEFRFFGGDLMTAVGGTRVRHYKELAYMGFIPVLLHLPTILKNMKMCKQDITDWKPDCVILVDYPGFNLKIAEYIGNEKRKAKSDKFPDGRIPQIFYYISPKIWAWKEYRIKNIRRDVDELLSILPFEVDFFEKKHHYPIHYVGNPTADEVREFSHSTFHIPHSTKKIIALLAGSRKQEIKDNLPAMLDAVEGIAQDYRIVIAGAPAIEPLYYNRFTRGRDVEIVYNETYPLLAQAHAALVTSGTATLETCLFGVPQVVCYKVPLPKILGYLRRHLLKVKYISLVNLVADREVVKELLAETFSVENIRHELLQILDGEARERMLEGYAEVARRLGDQNAPETAARIIVGKCKNVKE